MRSLLCLAALLCLAVCPAEAGQYAVTFCTNVDVATSGLTVKKAQLCDTSGNYMWLNKVRVDTGNAVMYVQMDYNFTTDTYSAPSMWPSAENIDTRLVICNGQVMGGTWSMVAIDGYYDYETCKYKWIDTSYPNNPLAYTNYFDPGFP